MSEENIDELLEKIEKLTEELQKVNSKMKNWYSEYASNMKMIDGTLDHMGRAISGLISSNNFRNAFALNIMMLSRSYEQKYLM